MDDPSSHFVRRMATVGSSVAAFFAIVVVAAASPAWLPAVHVGGHLNTGHAAGISAVSCSSAGNCMAVGSYKTPHGKKAMAVTETNGVWGAPHAVATTLSQPELGTVSCTNDGYCTVGGDFTRLRPGPSKVPFLESEVHDRRGATRIIREWTDPLANGTVTAVACRAVGYCTAGGTHSSFDTNGNGTGQQASVTTMTHGHWGPAIDVAVLQNSGWRGAVQEIAGPPLDTGAQGGITAIACAADGYCLAGGQYAHGTSTEPCVVSNTHVSDLHMTVARHVHHNTLVVVHISGTARGMIVSLARTVAGVAVASTRTAHGSSVAIRMRLASPGTYTLTASGVLAHTTVVTSNTVVRSV